ncbi:hypothetical protein PR003_g16196 [Phytophthora rubi]|nr:hypothetical protein PR003_g16196 [Phytophthora rubi]
MLDCCVRILQCLICSAPPVTCTRTGGDSGCLTTSPTPRIDTRDMMLLCAPVSRQNGTSRTILMQTRHPSAERTALTGLVLSLWYALFGCSDRCASCFCASVASG